MGEARVLPPDVFDALELSALAFGGIGRGRYFDAISDGCSLENIPLCIHGHMDAAGIDSCHQVRDYLDKRGISVDDNDEAVCAINDRNNRSIIARVSFSDWCAELNVIRGS